MREELWSHEAKGVFCVCVCVLLLLMTRLSFLAARQYMFAGRGVGSRRAPPTPPRCHVAPLSMASSFTLEWLSSVPVTPFSRVSLSFSVCYCCVYSQQDWRARPSHTLAAAAAAAAFRAATDSRFPALSSSSSSSSRHWALFIPPPLHWKHYSA